MEYLNENILCPQLVSLQQKLADLHLHTEDTKQKLGDQCEEQVSSMRTKLSDYLTLHTKKIAEKEAEFRQNAAS